jgi:hypothetical protein
MDSGEIDGRCLCFATRNKPRGSNPAEVLVESHTAKNLLGSQVYEVAEREGFEPPVPYGTTVFKTAAFDHSAISPRSKLGNLGMPRVPASKFYRPFQSTRIN